MFSSFWVGSTITEADATQSLVVKFLFRSPRSRRHVREVVPLKPADCTLKATRSHTTCRVALPGAHPTQRHARPRAAGRHSPKRLSGLSGGVLRVLRRLGGPCERGGVVVS